MADLFAKLRKEHIVAPPGFNRWRVPPASIAIHLCIGSVYAWSVFNAPLTKALGVVGSAPSDWTLTQVTWVFSIAILFLGLSAAVAGKWLEKVGPRMVGVTAACCWGGGFFAGGLGILTHQLWLLYLGYGVIGGCGLGLGYVSPVSTLIRWFPDRRGMATGMAIVGFGGGAAIGAPLIKTLIGFFARPATDLGAIANLDMVTQGGVRFARVAGELCQVVVANVSTGSAKPVEHAFLVGSGSTGLPATFFTLGVLYFTVMLIAAFLYRVPAANWKPAGWSPDAAQQAGKMITTNHVHIDQALKTPQFYLLWVVLCFNITAGIGILALAQDMMTDIFGTALPSIVVKDGPFVTTYVVMISLFNMGGRFFWASVSDYIGRKTAYYIFFVLGIMLYLSIPFTAQRVSVSPSMVWLVYFYAATMVIFTMYGGGFSSIPAYLADIFGTRYVGGIHGRLLTAWSVAGVLGKVAITGLRDQSVRGAIQNLASKVDPAAFQAKFGASIQELPVLVEKKTVTIAKLMELAPPGTVDPTSMIYNNAMYVMAGLLAVALVANALVRPVHEDHHMSEEELQEQLVAK